MHTDCKWQHLKGSAERSWQMWHMPLGSCLSRICTGQSLVMHARCPGNLSHVRPEVSRSVEEARSGRERA